MHYCPVCDEPHLMIIGHGVARCPECGDIDYVAATRPLFVVTGASGSGKSTLFPLLLERLAGRPGGGDIHYLVLDCPDDVRRQRIEARPRWRGRDIEKQTEFARWLRANLAPVVDTDALTPAAAADAVVAWAADRTDL